VKDEGFGKFNDERWDEEVETQGKKFIFAAQAVSSAHFKRVKQSSEGTE
jgi:hypothetical protein